MATTRDELKQRVLDALDVVPEEVLEEVVAYLDYQRSKLGPRESEVPPYRPIALSGIWEGVHISDEDIAEVRREMWHNFGDRGF